MKKTIKIKAYALINKETRGIASHFPYDAKPVGEQFDPLAIYLTQKEAREGARIGERVVICTISFSHPRTGKKPVLSKRK